MQIEEELAVCTEPHGQTCPFWEERKQHVKDQTEYMITRLNVDPMRWHKEFASQQEEGVTMALPQRRVEEVCLPLS